MLEKPSKLRLNEETIKNLHLELGSGPLVFKNKKWRYNATNFLHTVGYESSFRISYLKQAQVEGCTRKTPFSIRTTVKMWRIQPIPTSGKDVEVRGSSTLSGYLPFLIGNFETAKKQKQELQQGNAIFQKLQVW